MQIAEDPQPKPFYRSLTLLAIPIIAGAASAKWGGWLTENQAGIADLIGMLVVVVGRWRAGGLHIPGVGAKGE